MKSVNQQLAEKMTTLREAGLTETVDLIMAEKISIEGKLAKLEEVASKSTIINLNESRARGENNAKDAKKMHEALVESSMSAFGLTRAEAEIFARSEPSATVEPDWVGLLKETK